MAINLLSPKEKRAVRSMYRIHRLIAALLVCDLLLVSAIVLIGALDINLRQEKATNEKSLTVLGSQTKVVEFNKIRDEVNLIAKYTKLAKRELALVTTPSVELETIFTARHKGIRLVGIDYLTAKNNTTVQIKGIAASRQDLLTFTSKLESLPIVKSVDSPVANLVGDTNAPFTLAVELTKPKTNE